MRVENIIVAPDHGPMWQAGKRSDLGNFLCRRRGVDRDDIIASVSSVLLKNINLRFENQKSCVLCALFAVYTIGDDDDDDDDDREVKVFLLLFGVIIIIRQCGIVDGAIGGSSTVLLSNCRRQ